METVQSIKRNRIKIIYPLIFLGVLVYIGFLILDYNEASLAVGLSSRSIRFQQGVLRNGTDIVPRDFLRGFDILCFDNAASRVRFIGWTVEVFDAKALLWLSRYLPPHPSFSLNWILTLVLTPLVLFKLVRFQSRSYQAAWIAVILLLISAGSLSGITLRDGPFKPLVNFFTLCAFYLAAVSDRLQKRSQHIELKSIGVFFGMLAVVFISLFTDETSWFLYLAIPILYPKLFVKPKRGLYWGSYLGMFVLFLLIITFLAPVLVERYGSGGFDLWGYIITPDDAPDVTMWERWNMNNLLLSVRNLAISQFIPWNQPWWGVAYLIIVPFLAMCYFRLPAARRRLFLRYLLLLGVYLVFIIFYLGKGAEGEQVLMTPYYYGALFSVLSILPLAILLSAPLKGIGETARLMMVIFLAIVFMYNFPFMHKMERSFFEGDIRRQRRINPAEVVRAWQNWDNPEIRKDFIARFPDRWFWFFPLTEPEIVRGRHLERFPPPPEVSLLEPNILTAGPVLPGSLPAANLIDDDAGTFWRSPLEEEPPWVKVDFRERQGARIKYVAMLPRRGRLEEFPRRLDLLGSVDGEIWSLVVPLLHPEGPPGDQGVSWRFVNHAPYRFYKLVFLEGYPDAEEQCVSLAELRLSP